VPLLQAAPRLNAIALLEGQAIKREQGKPINATSTWLLRTIVPLHRHVQVRK
jgi:hypothetical protein